MAQQLWSFIRNFSATKYYSTPQAGSLNGTPPFSLGAIFAATVIPSSGAVFCNGVPGATGFAIRHGATTTAVSNGTVSQFTGAINNTTGAVLPDATDLTTSEALANAYKSNVFGGATIAAARGSESLHSVELVHAAVTIAAGGNQLYYINGHLVHTITAAHVSSASPVFIGIDPALTIPATNLWLAGTWYTGAVYNPTEMAAMHAACVTYKDLAGPSKFMAAVDPAYMWSVKRGNYDARAAWLSDGSAVNPLTMARSGLWLPTSSAPGIADGDVLAAEVQWMQL